MAAPVPADDIQPQVAPGSGPSVSHKVDAAIQAAAELAAISVTNAYELQGALTRIRRGEKQAPVIWERAAGVLEFLSLAFPRHEETTLCGQVFTREPEGRGAHFDVYDSLLDPAYPWVAVFNLAGDSVVSVFPLPDQLARRYAREHPEATDDAYLKRRRLADEALADPSIRPEKGLLLAGYGLIIPQQQSGPKWVHDVVPISKERPGRFVKFAAARDGRIHELYERGYAGIESLLKQALLHAPTEGAGNSENQRRRRCNLD